MKHLDRFFMGFTTCAVLFVLGVLIRGTVAVVRMYPLVSGIVVGGLLIFYGVGLLAETYQFWKNKS